MEPYHEWQCQWSSTYLQISPSDAWLLLYRNCTQVANDPSPYLCMNSSQKGNTHNKERAVNPTRAQNTDCQPKKVTCAEKTNLLTNGNVTFWNCTDGLIHIYMTCLKSGTESAGAASRNCCEFHVQTPSYRSTKRPASCVLIYIGNSDLAWDCKLESAKLRIFTKKDGTFTNCSYTDGYKNRNDRCTATLGAYGTNTSGRHSTTKLGHHRTATLGSHSSVNTDSQMYFTLLNFVSTTSGYHLLTPARSYATPTVKSIISTTIKIRHDVNLSNKPSTPTPFLKTKQPAFTTVAGGIKEPETKNGTPLINETMKDLGESLNGVIARFNCTSVSVEEMLLDVEQRLPPLIKVLLNSTGIEDKSFSNEIIELHAVVTSDLNKTIEVPANSTKQSQASLRLMPGFIDITHDRLAIVAVVFKFDALCNNTKELTMGSPGTKRRSALKAPIVSFTAITNRGSLKMLQNNATITFRTKSQSNSTACRFLDSSSGNTPFWSGSGLTYVHSQDQNSSSTICLTNHFTSFAVLVSYHGQDESKFSKDEKKALDLFTKIGCGIAIVCLVACIFTFACVRSLSILRYRIHLNLCISLAGSLLLFVAGIEATDIKGVCIAVAVMLHYFFTASFAWMCVEAIHLFTKVVSVFDVQTTKMRYYFALGWGLPAVIVVISLSANYKGYSTSKVCWLEGDSAWAFIVPVIIIVLINIAVLVAVVAVRVSLKGHPLTPNEDKRFTAALKAVVILFPLFGLCWVFGLVGVVARSKAFLYAFVVLSTFQGVFILLFHCIGNTEVRSALKKVQERHSLSSSIKNEQKNKSKDYKLKRMHKDNITSTSEKKGLLAKLSVAKCDRRQRNDPTAV
ncbi:unnamed protein product [Porites evermanni]|uniref:Uncharacterized protein n=1 Tax=Porites evermanni TaxID=104178 RepID=A0ABN8QYF7_9CNID|nr:unnamed protein product [Porites evermanni]